MQDDFLRDSLARPLRSTTESDGTSNFSAKDAPGQSCSYILSGDHRNEYYRLGTYGRFPQEVPVPMPDMAASGFYYTGYKDRVKCFSCGVTVENWVIGDDGTDRQWHKTNCNMANGTATENQALPVPNYRTVIRELRELYNVIPRRTPRHGQFSREVASNIERTRRGENTESYPQLIFGNIVDPEFERRLRATNLRSEYERRKTFERFPTYPSPHLVGDMAKEGFFYLGNLDRTQCFTCSGVLRNWGPNDSVMEQHSKHFPQCRMVRGLSCGNIPMTEAERSQADAELMAKLSRLSASHGEPPDPLPEVQRHLAIYLPCNDPVNPHMRSLERRTETFNQDWPSSRIHAPVEQIARAGFFYLGQGDKTKCFYCNGGLQNWDPNDEPWTEHAKWFPRCQYILRQKGVDFVRALAEDHPNLNRPLIRNPVLYENIPPFSSSQETSSNDPSINIDMSQIRSMGFSEEQVARALARAAERSVQPYTEELVQYLLEDCGPDIQQQVASPGHQSRSVPMQGAAESTSKEDTDPKTKVNSMTMTEEELSMAESLREMTEMSLCRQCKRNKAEIVFTPCGHLALCEGCSPEAKKCVICGSRIHGKLKVYRA